MWLDPENVLALSLLDQRTDVSENIGAIFAIKIGVVFVLVSLLIKRKRREPLIDARLPVLPDFSQNFVYDTQHDMELTGGDDVEDFLIKITSRQGGVVLATLVLSQLTSL